MVYIKSEIMEIVEKALGKDADGVYISWEELQYGTKDNVYSSSDMKVRITNYDEFEIRRGVSKIVIIPFGKPYVIKIGITHVYEERKDNFREIIAKLRPEEDSLAYECDIYSCCSELAKRLLMENIYVGKFNGLDVYIQEKADTVFSDVGGSFVFEEDKIKFADMVDWYTNNKYDFKLFGSHFCLNLYNAGFTFDEIICLDDEFFDLRIEDLHYGNICFDMDGNMRILDYAGYNEDYHWDYF